MTYVVHGATGAQGAPVAAILVAHHRSVVGLTRRNDAVIDGARTQALDLLSVDELKHAYEGAEGVFIHLPIDTEERRKAYGAAILEALLATRPTRVLFSTSGGAPAPGLDPGHTTSEAVSTLVDGLRGSGLNHAVIAPRLFLENLLLPPVVDAARDRGTLPYPLRADFPVSWASHLDVADVALDLFDRPDVTGTVDVGQNPGITGPDLADDFAAYFGRDVAFEAHATADFGKLLTPILGPSAAGVMGLYEHLGTLEHNAVAPDLSAEALLGRVPRTTLQWLRDVGV